MLFYPMQKFLNFFSVNVFQILFQTFFNFHFSNDFYLIYSKVLQIILKFISFKDFFKQMHFQVFFKYCSNAFTDYFQRFPIVLQIFKISNFSQTFFKFLFNFFSNFFFLIYCKFFHCFPKIFQIVLKF